MKNFTFPITSFLSIFTASALFAEAEKLQPSQFEWHPERSPEGPVLIVVSRDDQVAYVYRNGIEIARSTVSTGKEGHTTPTGVFSILQKHADHYSSTYNNAPMPYMQRLTWKGIALHAGNLPGYPASHGCIRLPYEFSKKLFGVTDSGGTVVITAEHSAPDKSAKPYQLLTHLEENAETAAQERGLFGKVKETWWKPEKEKQGHLSIVVSTADRAVHVLRNGVQIGEAPIQFTGDPKSVPPSVFIMLNELAERESAVVPGKQARTWASVGIEKNLTEENLWAFAEKLNLPGDFARRLYDELEPGTLVMITPEAMQQDKRSGADFSIAVAENPTKEAPAEKE